MRLNLNWCIRGRCFGSERYGTNRGDRFALGLSVRGYLRWLRGTFQGFARKCQGTLGGLCGFCFRGCRTWDYSFVCFNHTVFTLLRVWQLLNPLRDITVVGINLSCVPLSIGASGNNSASDWVLGWSFEVRLLPFSVSVRLSLWAGLIFSSRLDGATVYSGELPPETDLRLSDVFSDSSVRLVASCNVSSSLSSKAPEAWASTNQEIINSFFSIITILEIPAALNSQRSRRQASSSTDNTEDVTESALRPKRDDIGGATESTLRSERNDIEGAIKSTLRPERDDIEGATESTLVLERDDVEGATEAALCTESDDTENSTKFFLGTEQISCIESFSCYIRAWDDLFCKSAVSHDKTLIAHIWMVLQNCLSTMIYDTIRSRKSFTSPDDHRKRSSVNLLRDLKCLSLDSSSRSPVRTSSQPRMRYRSCLTMRESNPSFRASSVTISPVSLRRMCKLLTSREIFLNTCGASLHDFQTRPKTRLAAAWRAKPGPIPVNKRVLPGLARPVRSNLRFCFSGFTFYHCIQICYI